MVFAKATLRKVSDKPANPPKAEPGQDPITVQINPATLRLQATASVDSGKDAGRARTQYQGTTSTLTFDLVFDTSDEGTTEVPIDVRSRTSKVEQFVWPAGPKASPPRVEFRYGPLTVVGTMTSFNMDLDLFSANGVPLRAKCAVTIKEQKPAFDLVQEGAGAKPATGATAPLQPSTAAAPGGATTAPAPTDRTGTALAGETASAFANRMGVDPRAWKGLQGVTDPLNLQAGQQINFRSTLSVEAGLGVQVGASTGATSSAGATLTPGGSVTAPDGRELTSAGGLTRSLSDAAGEQASAAAAAASNAFASLTSASTASPEPTSTFGAATPAAGSIGLSRSGPTGSPGGPGSSPTGGLSGGGVGGTAASTIDSRAVGYGFGVPLRPRRGVVGPATLGLVHERNRRVMSGGELPPQSRDSSVPSWYALPPAPSSAGSVAGPSCGCGSEIRSGGGSGCGRCS